MDNNISEITDWLAKERDEKRIQHFLESILTEAELKDIALRWELVKRLDIGHSQRKIAKDLKLSLCKITRGSRELKKENSIFKQVITELEV